MHLFCIMQYTFICSGICYHTAVILIKGYELRLLVWMLFATYCSSPFSAVSKISHQYLHQGWWLGIVLVSHCRRRQCCLHSCLVPVRELYWCFQCLQVMSCRPTLPSGFLCLKAVLFEAASLLLRWDFFLLYSSLRKRSIAKEEWN